jgi:hypothetical protein
MLRPAVVIIIFSVIVAGCSLYRVDSKDLSSDLYLPKDSADQIVYIEKLDKPYDVIALLKITADRTSPLEDILVRMRYEAAVLGADAVTDVVSDHALLRVEYTAKAVVFK